MSILSRILGQKEQLKNLARPIYSGPSGGFEKMSADTAAVSPETRKLYADFATPPVQPWAFCEQCGVCYSVDKIDLFPVLSVRRRPPHMVARVDFHWRHLCQSCRPQGADFLLLLGDPASPEETRRFSLKEGWLEDVDDLGESQYLVSIAQYNVAICADCGEANEPKPCANCAKRIARKKKK